jgi:hypothetical protein
VFARILIVVSFLAVGCDTEADKKRKKEIDKKVDDDVMRKDLEKNGFTPAQAEAAVPKPKEEPWGVYKR